MSANCSAFPDTSEAYSLCDSLNTVELGLKADSSQFFLIWAASLVIFMHAGFAMLSAGSVRTKNTKNILLMITLDLCVCCIAWWFVGFAFAFGADHNNFIGTTNFVGLDVGDSSNLVVSFGFWLFQFSFAATSATIVSGAVAERARFESYLIYSCWMSMWVYPVFTHWVWGGGWLTLGNSDSILGVGCADFAGDGPVHMVGGIAGMLASKIMGPRIGRFDSVTGEPIPMPGHSSALANLGTFILIVGWLGFNPGSILNINNGGGVFAGRAAVNTVLAMSTGTIAALLTSYAAYRTWDFSASMNGALAGLVSITGPCAWLEGWAALVTGLVGGALYVGASAFTLRVLKIDDPLDASAVHVFCGAWGLFAGGMFADPTILAAYYPGSFGAPAKPVGGFVYGVGGTLLGAQMTEVAACIAWVVGNTFPLFMLLKSFGILRVPVDQEEDGIDVSHHGGAAYPEEKVSKV